MCSLLLKELFKFFFFLIFLHCSWCCAVCRPLHFFPYVVHHADYILDLSFEIRGYILRNQKFKLVQTFILAHRCLVVWTLYDTDRILKRLYSWILESAMCYSLAFVAGYCAVAYGGRIAETLGYDPCIFF